jgi:hypothetical protein
MVPKQVLSDRIDRHQLAQLRYGHQIFQTTSLRHYAREIDIRNKEDHQLLNLHRLSYFCRGGILRDKLRIA